MHHIRVISPRKSTDEVVGLLRKDPGVTHLSVHPDAAVKPAGDVIEADVTREVVHPLLCALQRHDLERDGGITVSTVDTVMSDAADEAERAVPGDPSDAVVWEELTSRTREESTLNLTFVAFLTLAVVLAMLGVITDSTVTVVGAMVVGPEFGPLAGLAVALATRRLRLALRPLIALTVGFPVALILAWLAAEALLRTGLYSKDVLASADDVDFIYKVGPYSLMVALVAGAAGMISLVTAKSAALVGVFISVTTVPAAGYGVVAATVGDWGRAVQSVLQLGINLVGIVVAGVVVLWLRPATWRHLRDAVAS